MLTIVVIGAELRHVRTQDLRWGARIPLGVCGSAVFVVGSDGFLGGMARHDIDLDRTRAH